jgi:hypothetical protein
MIMLCGLLTSPSKALVRATREAAPKTRDLTMDIVEL